MGGRYIINENYCWSNDFNGCLFDNENTYKELFIDNNRLLIKKINYETEEITHGIFDFIKRESVLYNSEQHINGRPYKTLSENEFITLNNKGFYCYQFSNMYELWERNFAELLEGDDIKQIGNIITHNGKLYFYLYDNKGSNRATICLDAQTGNLLHKYDNFGGDLFIFGKKIGVAANYTVQVLDTETNTIQEYDFSSELEKYELKIGWNGNVFTEKGLLYFMGTKEAKNKIGILDLNKQKLIWHTDFEIPESEFNINQQVNSIKLQNDRLYVHCSDETLYIFEQN